ncbi:hypothetical protein DFR58_1315 [Anaerobacterium chartisolvens]|uniref:AEC family transporter n=1 Tax=Anaerobacterium chartisolvens TaxID=1297424 RepID=A0A369ALA8_9FIRM|nr:AEC family transporter [Anaerobacterium chartisolvens]RCX09961.1 hypothetical protein DFR58_1315 [Anaerobacterium chartisolvens]
MQEALLVGRQVLLIFIFIFIGIACIKKKIVSEEAGKSFSNFVLAVVMPCLMVNSYLRPVEKEHLKGLALAFLLAVVFHIMAIVLSSILIKRREDARYRIERLAAIYSNCGFMAFPLISVAVGDIGLFYAVAFISVFNVLIWSNGIITLTGRKSFSLKACLLNPGFIGFITGIVLYLTSFPVPGVIRDAVSAISLANTPLAMITTGMYLAGINFKTAFRNVNIYFTTAIRLIVLPLIMLLIIKLCGVAGWMQGADDVIMSSILACACPVAASVTLMPARFGLDGEYGAMIIAVSTLFSIITLPLFNLLTRILI